MGAGWFDVNTPRRNPGIRPHHPARAQQLVVQRQRAIVAIAASLLGGPPVDLEDTASSLDRQSLTLVLAALAYAAGSDEDNELVYDVEAQPTHFKSVPSVSPGPKRS